MLQLILAVLLIVAVFVAIKRGLDARALVAVIVVVDALGLLVAWPAATIMGYGLSVVTLVYIVCAALGISLPGFGRKR